MEERKAEGSGLQVRGYADIFMAAYAPGAVSCTARNHTHILVYMYGGELEIREAGDGDGAEATTRTLHRGDCAFVRRDISVQLTKRSYYGMPFKAVFLGFTPRFLRDSHTRLHRAGALPEGVRRSRVNVYPIRRGAAVDALFSELEPYFSEEAGVPSDALLAEKMDAGLRLILDADPEVCASLFDFVKPWKINIMDFMEKHFMQEMSLEEMALYTGRSLSAFKRDFSTFSALSPQKWLIQRRLRAAYDMLAAGAAARVSDACYSVGFKNISHFSRAFRDFYGTTPASLLRHA